MGRKLAQYISGEQIGKHSLIFVEEMPYIDKGSYKQRMMKVICPECKEEFIIDLRRIVRSDTKKKSSIKKCPSCAKKENNKE